MKTRLLSFLLLLMYFIAAASSDRADAAEGGPPQRVTVEIIEGVAEGNWPCDCAAATEKFEQAAFAFPSIPHKYNDQALIADRTSPFMLRATVNLRLPAGEHRLLLRSLHGARLILDGRVIAKTPFAKPDGDGHDPVPDVPEPPAAGVRRLPLGHAEELVAITSDGGQHVFMLEAFVGGKRLRQELGELSVSIARDDGMFYLLTNDPELRVPLTDEGWASHARNRLAELEMVNGSRRRIVGAEESRYWDARRRLAAQYIEQTTDTPTYPDIDSFVDARLAEAGLKHPAPTDDYAFLRRVCLDTIGVPPSPAEIEAFFADAPQVRRARAVERLLADRRWADHWVSYWQDVLAENPGIVKPMLNNTGPFRQWIHESLLDNKPVDRFATELIMMGGSAYYGGPAGFAIATQNDVPMAEKAHVISQAFLAVELKCARCHDAPFHDAKQRDLFSLAAMLKRSPQQVPETSSIPTGTQESRRLNVEVTLSPGEKVDPHWPLESLARPNELPPQVLRHADDPRERLAALVTWPANRRFAAVAVNRLWARYMGRGIVEPVDDWDMAEPSHPQLLDFLSRELVLSGYDLKHISRLILNSRAYQRRAGNPHLFASPARRRMTAEQVADSLFAVAGKEFEAEHLSMDVEGRRPVQAFLNLGLPRRGWQFASLSNERDRPALSMPRAQTIVDVLLAFGWRESRPGPLTIRDHSPTVQQPAILRNGVAAQRVATLSDDSALTKLCLDEQMPLDDLVHAMFLRILTRPPNQQERSVFMELLRDGYDKRIVAGVSAADDPTGVAVRPVSWSNHLSPDATLIKMQLERSARAGDAPTSRLNDDWRSRMEDMVWALINSPEFLFVP